MKDIKEVDIHSDNIASIIQSLCDVEYIDAKILAYRGIATVDNLSDLDDEAVAKEMVGDYLAIFPERACH